MTNSTAPKTYRYWFQGRTIELTRKHVGTAYPKNGNVGNPTEYFTWSASVDGTTVATLCDKRATAYEFARANVLGIRYVPDHPDRPGRSVNVRPFTAVRDEMQANYVGRPPASRRRHG